MDSYEYSVVLVDADAGDGYVGRVTNSPEQYVEGAGASYKAYAASPAMEINPTALTGDFSTGEYILKNLDASEKVFSGLAQNLPYSKVEVTIRELFFDGEGALTGSEYLFKGFVYQVMSRRAQGLVDLVLRDHKYYVDTTAGIPCTELCAVNYFGDDQCGVTVIHETQTIATVSGNTLTIGADLANDTAYLYNKGYVVLGAQRIKIQYHNTGRVFEMARKIPASWTGEVELYSGCDRTLATCKNIHVNEARFLGLGIAMVDYNPLYEET